MAVHLDLGKQGEDIAVEWLVKNNYKVLHRNWRFGYDEIDIIALKSKANDRFNRGNFLHFIEVKTRNFSKHGRPEDAVSKTKFRKLQRIANQFLLRNPGYKWVQYDVLAITIYKEKETEIFLLADVYL
jgi:putative endonuclease